MAPSVVHFKFRSARAVSSVSFQGASVELKMLKKLIVGSMKLRKDTDFDFKITDAKTNTGGAESHLLPQRTNVAETQPSPVLCVSQNSKETRHQFRGTRVCSLRGCLLHRPLRGLQKHGRTKCTYLDRPLHLSPRLNP